MSRFFLLCSAALFLAEFGFSARADDQTFNSGANRAHLLELYTSEGCSSCPPAETWLSHLKTEPRLWSDFVPIAFHVDYWDRLGWRDPFAAKEWTARQYTYSASWKSESVYTPGFVLDAREWQNNRVPAPGTESPGTLKVAVANDGSAKVMFAPSTKNGAPLEVHLAQLGFGLRTNVGAGENRGRQLLHDFVVLSLATEPLSAGEATMRLAKTEKPTGAVAVWITERSGLEPIQATGGWLK